jgi:DNA-binding MarR family transcriptional regulator
MCLRLDEGVSTGYLLARVCRRLRAQIHSTLHGIGLYRGQQFVLRTLWDEEGITHSELARRLQVQPATVTNALKRMEKAGFVERRHDPEDERVSRVYLTDAGRNIRDAVEQAWARVEEETFAGLSQEEHETLHRLLLKLHHNVSREDCRA